MYVAHPLIEEMRSALRLAFTDRVSGNRYQVAAHRIGGLPDLKGNGKRNRIRSNLGKREVAFQKEDLRAIPYHHIQQDQHQTTAENRATRRCLV